MTSRIANMPTRDQIEQRVMDLMIDDTHVVELIEEIQELGGPAHADLCRGLRKVITYAPRHPEHERGLDLANDVIERQAWRRAVREHLTEARV